MNTRINSTYIYNNTDINYTELFAENRYIQIKSYLPSSVDDKILELGCGNGSFASILKSKYSVPVYGLDASRSGIQLAKKKEINAQTADLNTRMPFRDNMFSMVISDQVFEHILNTDLFLKESQRVLKKNGILIIITPNLSFWFNRIIFLLGFYPFFPEISMKDKTYGYGFLKGLMSEKEAMGHIRVANVPALVDFVTALGFVNVRIHGLPLSWTLPQPVKSIYNFIDFIFSLRPTFARDIMLIASKA